MKKFITISIFIFSTIVYSQINTSYEVIQKRFGGKNIKQLQDEENHFELKQLSTTETIKFTYNENKIVTIIEIESNQTFSNDKYHELAKKLIPKFKLTSSGSNDKLDFYYDSKNEILNIKLYKTPKKLKLNKVIFMSDTKIISEIIPEINKWK